jgi:hypothetical protein
MISLAISRRFSITGKKTTLERCSSMVSINNRTHVRICEAFPHTQLLLSRTSFQISRSFRTRTQNHNTRERYTHQKSSASHSREIGQRSRRKGRRTGRRLGPRGWNRNGAGRLRDRRPSTSKTPGFVVDRVRNIQSNKQKHFNDPFHRSAHSH